MEGEYGGRSQDNDVTYDGSLEGDESRRTGILEVDVPEDKWLPSEPV